MATSLKAYADAALSAVVYNPNVLQKADGSTGPVDFVVYVGSALSGKRIEAQSNPGVDDIVLSVVDADTGAGQGAGAVKLALSAAGLDSAAGGEPLVLGTEVLSGVAGAVAVHVRVEATNLSVGAFDGLVLETNELVETDA